MGNSWPMRRKDRIIDDNEARKIAEKALFGVLATVGEKGEPYAVPLSFVLRGDTVYFHCAKSGRKVESLKHERRVCFVVVGDNEPVYQKNFTTLYESVIIEGVATEVEDESEKRQALLWLCEKYLPKHMDKAPAGIEGSIARTMVVRIDIEKISGKAKR